MGAPANDGPSRMRELALELPRQMREGFHTARSLDARVTAAQRAVVLAGMGGSAIAGDLAATLTEPETAVTLSVNRSPELPRAVDRNALVLIASYSGNTWETLAAYDEAGRRGAPRIALTSGGRLAERSAEDGVPCLLIPPGSPPRAAVGYLFGGILGLLDPVFPESNEDRLMHAADHLEGRLPAYSSPRGLPEQWARRLGARHPAIYAENGFLGLARRWKTQVEENAKRPAEFDVLPELFHNALVAWDAAGPTEGRHRGVVQLEWSESSRPARDRHDYLARVLRRRRVPDIRVPLVAPDRLVALVHGLALGDLFSLALARQADVDPFPVEAIGRMKRELEARPADRRRAASS